MLAILRRHQSHHQKLGCRFIRRFRVLDGNLTLAKEEHGVLLKESKKYEDVHTEKLTKVLAGSGEKAIMRHTQQNKKILVRDRIKLLVDDDYPILELSPLAGLGMAYGDILSAGIICVIAKISGQLCIINANDATVKGGTVFPISLKKQLRMQEIAVENNLPCVYLVDSGGGFLPLQAEIFVEGGRCFYNEAIMNSKGIPQLCMVAGSCTAGAAYIPTMANEVVMVDKIGSIFLAGPPLVHAAIGQVISEEDLGGATVHCEVSGCADYKVKDENEGIEVMKDVMSTLNLTDYLHNETSVEEPCYDMNDLSLLSVMRDAKGKLDIRKILARIVDGSRFHEFKPTFGVEIVAGFARVNGILTGVVANNGLFTPDACLKASNFIALCDERGIPIVFFQDIIKDTDSEKSTNLIKYQSQMMSYVATSKVPKVTVIIGNSFGVGNYAMCGRSMSPRFLYLWPTASVSLDEVEYSKTYLDEESDIKKLELESSCYYSSAYVCDDGVILPSESRNMIGLSLVASMTHKETTKSADKNVVRL